MTEQQHRELTSTYVKYARAVKAGESYDNWKRRDWLKRARQHYTKARNIAYFVSLGYNRAELESR